jgi:hypothetical protein
MAIEDRIRSSVDAALAELTARVDKDVRAIVQQLITIALEERDAASNSARQAALDEAGADTRRQIEAAEARVEAEAGQKLNEALAGAETRLQRALAEADAKASQVLQETVADAHVVEREYEMAVITRLLESLRRLDGSTSLSEVLDALAEAAGREASRAAVLVLRNDRLLGWRLSGFGTHDAQPKGIDLGLSDSGVIGLAVGAARPMTTREGQTASAGPGFAHLPADLTGFAVPVIVGGRVVAAVYADSVESEGKTHTVPNAWPEIVEILARHAARCLEALTAQKAASAASPRFWGGRHATEATPQTQTKPRPDSATTTAGSGSP